MDLSMDSTDSLDLNADPNGISNEEVKSDIKISSSSSNNGISKANSVQIDDSDLKNLVISLQSEVKQLKEKVQAEKDNRKRLEKKMKEVIARLNDLSGLTNQQILLMNAMKASPLEMQQLLSQHPVINPSSIAQNISPSVSNSPPHPPHMMSSPGVSHLNHSSGGVHVVSFPSPSQIPDRRKQKTSKAPDFSANMFSTSKHPSIVRPVNPPKPNNDLINRAQQILMNQAQRVQQMQSQATEQRRVEEEENGETRPSAIQHPDSDDEAVPVEPKVRRRGKNTLDEYDENEQFTPLDDSLDEEYVKHITELHRLRIEQKTIRGRLPQPDFYTNMDLVLWLNAMTRKYKKHLLKPEQIIPLNEIGFQWRELKKITPWPVSVAKLAQVKAETGGFDVAKSSLKEDRYFLHWIRNTRSQYEKGILKEDKIRDLKELGFIYTDPTNALTCSIADASLGIKGVVGKVVRIGRTGKRKKKQESESEAEETDTSSEDESDSEDEKPSKKKKEEEDDVIVKPVVVELKNETNQEDDDDVFSAYVQSLG